MKSRDVETTAGGRLQVSVSSMTFGDRPPVKVAVLDPVQGSSMVVLDSVQLLDLVHALLTANEEIDT